MPADNPFVSRSGAQPALWSYGHRNPQGAAIHPATGELWAVEHGPQGGDELNVVRAGLNYGWPLISYGCEYGSTPADTCATVGGATAAAGMEQPITYWVPYSTAPSGLMFYTGSRFTAWTGKAYAGALSGKTLWQFDVDQSGAIVCTTAQRPDADALRRGRAGEEPRKRIRDVRQARTAASTCSPTKAIRRTSCCACNEHWAGAALKDPSGRPGHSPKPERLECPA